MWEDLANYVGIYVSYAVDVAGQVIQKIIRWWNGGEDNTRGDELHLLDPSATVTNLDVIVEQLSINVVTPVEDNNGDQVTTITTTVDATGGNTTAAAILAPPGGGLLTAAALSGPMVPFTAKSETAFAAAPFQQVAADLSTVLVVPPP